MASASTAAADSLGVHQLCRTISAHAWNADRSMLALCPNTSELWIYAGCKDADSSTWERRWVLKQHDFVISAIDWHPVTNAIVTCSHDRSAFVWVFEGGGGAASTGTWAPQLVILQHRMACMDVKWSPDGRKFAVASGGKKAMICFYEATNKWWVAKETRKHKSTVLAVAWHPSGSVLATVSTDYECRIISAHIDEVDGPAESASSASAAASAIAQFGPLPDAGEVITSFQVTKAWLNDVTWSPSGRVLAFAGHDSLLHVVTFSGGGGGGLSAPTIQTFKCPTLPATHLLFLSESTLLTVGHSLNPELYTCAPPGAPGGGLWSFARYLDKRPEARAAVSTGGVAAARAMFASKVSKGQAAPTEGAAAELWTKHQNAIMGVKGYTANASGELSACSTHGNDGRLVIWQL